jgi:hypothetical protein
MWGVGCRRWVAVNVESGLKGYSGVLPTPNPQLKIQQKDRPKSSTIDSMKTQLEV